MISGTVGQSVLGSAADVEIELVLKSGGSSTTAPAGEVSAVASVTLDGLPKIAAVWRPLLSPIRLSITGVFCHASPKVDVSYPHGPPKQCELADLLIVTDEVNSAGIVLDRRANLIQAKLVKSGAVTTDPVQHHLLTGWPKFTFASSAYGTSPRTLSAPGLPGAAVDTGRYGAIDLQSTTRTWSQNLPTSPSVSGSGLGAFIAGMMLGAQGHGREAKKGGGDDWSATVDELLNVTALQSFRHAASLGPGKRAMRGVIALTLSGPGIEGGFSVRPPADASPTEPADRGISVIYISVQRPHD